MLENLTLTELNAMTKEAIIAEIVGNKTTETCTKSVDSVNGQVSREYVTKDALGVVLKTECWGWKYDEAGVVSEIVKTVLDEKAVPVEMVKIATVDGVLKSVPIVIKDIVPVEEVIITK